MPSRLTVDETIVVLKEEYRESIEENRKQSITILDKTAGCLRHACWRHEQGVGARRAVCEARYHEYGRLVRLYRVCNVVRAPRYLDVLCTAGLDSARAEEPPWRGTGRSISILGPIRAAKSYFAIMTPAEDEKSTMGLHDS